MTYSKYFQAQIDTKNCWFFVATLRSFEHLAFDRTLDKETSTFEFFVPAENEKPFIALMDLYTKMGIVSNFKELPNRFA